MRPDNLNPAEGLILTLGLLDETGTRLYTFPSRMQPESRSGTEFRQSSSAPGRNSGVGIHLGMGLGAPGCVLQQND